jgi:hypothetical protein
MQPRLWAGREAPVLAPVLVRPRRALDPPQLLGLALLGLDPLVLGLDPPALGLVRGLAPVRPALGRDLLRARNEVPLRLPVALPQALVERSQVPRSPRPSR